MVGSKQTRPQQISPQQIAPKRIPARKTEAFTAWAMPAFGNGKVVEVERKPAQRASGEQARSVTAENFERALIENIKAGSLPTRLTAGQLESIAKLAYAEGNDAGYREGYRESYEEGYAKAMQDAKAEIMQRITRLDNLLTGLIKSISDHHKNLEQGLGQLMVVLARGVIKRELELGSSQIQQLVTEALHALPSGAKGIRVLVSADDYKLLADYVAGNTAAEAASTVGKWQLEVDDQLSPGDCRLLTEQSMVDYCASDRLAQLMEQLLATRDES